MDDRPHGAGLLSSAHGHVFRYPLSRSPARGDLVELAPEDGHHLARVVRRRAGDRVQLFDGSGRLWDAEVVRVDRAVVVRVGSEREAPPDAPVRLCLGLLDSARLDLVVEKATELGVGECTVFAGARGRRAADDAVFARRRERLERVVSAACRQCGRARFMPVRGLVPFASIVADTAAGKGFLIDPRGDLPLTTALRGASGADGSLVLAIGPEAGFAADEVAAARAAGWHICTLGPNILRAETAAIAAATLACAALGQLDLVA
jgi:16S rRNA (uracil1498-N3)-methyltransferase